MSRKLGIIRDCIAWIKWVGKNELRAFEYLTKQKHVDDANSKQDDIANIIYGTLDHMYCDNCRFNSEIKESEQVLALTRKSLLIVLTNSRQLLM